MPGIAKVLHEHLRFLVCESYIEYIPMKMPDNEHLFLQIKNSVPRSKALRRECHKSLVNKVYLVLDCYKTQHHIIICSKLVGTIISVNIHQCAFKEQHRRMWDCTKKEHPM